MNDPASSVLHLLDKRASLSATLAAHGKIIITDLFCLEYHPIDVLGRVEVSPTPRMVRTMDLIREVECNKRQFHWWLEWNDEKAWNNITKSIKGWCRFLVIQIWRDGRSAKEDSMLSETAQEFRHSLTRVLAAEERQLPIFAFLNPACIKMLPVTVLIGFLSRSATAIFAKASRRFLAW